MLMDKTMPVSINYGNKMRGDKNIWGVAPRMPEEFYMLPDAEPGLAEMLGGGGGMSFRMGQPVNQLDQMIEYAEGKPGEFKMATDQYAARYSDQLNEMAKEELKQKYPNRDWDAEYKRTDALKDNYYNTGALWGPNGLTGNNANDVAKAIKPTFVSANKEKGIKGTGYTGNASAAKVKSYTGGQLPSTSIWNTKSRDGIIKTASKPKTTPGVRPGGYGWMR